MADKRPAYQWYPKDYLSDENVALMTLEQEGAYRRLMDYCWLQGSIPADLAQLARLCRVTEQDMERIWPGVEKCFRGRGDRLTHPRLDVERKKQASYREAKSRAGAAGAKAKWEKEKDGSAIDVPLAKDGFAVCSLQSSSSSASSKDERTYDSLSDWLGEYRGCLGGVSDYVQRSIFGIYGPTGTEQHVWRGIAPPRQPPILATAILSWSASDPTRFYRPFFTKILESAINDAIASDRKRAEEENDATSTEALRSAATALDVVEVARLNREGSDATERAAAAKAWYDAQPPDVQCQIDTTISKSLERFGKRAPAPLVQQALADAVEAYRGRAA